MVKERALSTMSLLVFRAGAVILPGVYAGWGEWDANLQF